jgi:Spy/CpxP family protein refolding chaperone
MKKAGIAVVSAVVMFLSFSYVYAQQDPSVGSEPKGVQGRHTYKHYAKRLGLDPQQKASLYELHRKFKGETAQLTGELVTKRQELQLLWTDPKADPEAILAKEGELRDLQNQMRDKVVHYRLEARKLLKPEQIEKLEFMGGMGPGFGRGFHHHEMGFRDSF